MIKHIPQKLSAQQNDMLFETFQYLPENRSTSQLSKDSLVFTQSKRTDLIQRQLTCSNLDRQQKILDHRFKRSPHQNNSNRNNILQQSLTRYLVKAFDSSLSKDTRITKNNSIYLKKQCYNCLVMLQNYQQHLCFLTKNNQQLYETMKFLSKEKQQLTTIIEKKQSYNRQLKLINHQLKDQNSFLLSTFQQYQVFEKLRHLYELEKKKKEVISQQKEMEIISKLNSYFKNQQNKQDIFPEIPGIKIDKQHQGNNKEKRVQTQYYQFNKNEQRQNNKLIKSKRQINLSQNFINELNTNLFNLSQDKKKLRFHTQMNQSISMITNRKLIRNIKASRSRIDIVTSINGKKDHHKIPKNSIKHKKSLK